MNNHNPNVSAVKKINMKDIRPIIIYVFHKITLIYGEVWKGLTADPVSFEEVLFCWQSYLEIFPDDVIKRATDMMFYEFLDYPPKLPQFSALCWRIAGIPSHADVIRAVVAEDFKHAVSWMFYKAVDKYALKSHAEERFLKESANAYQDAVISYKLNPVAFTSMCKQESEQFMQERKKKVDEKQRLTAMTCSEETAKILSQIKEKLKM